jgi:NAD(P)-dependent dehydrogenase (short-subunit alcohol dehydrogenase family)
VSTPERRALVTGASSGIGKATARLLAGQGYRVALLARSEDKLRALAAELPGEGHVVLVCDLCHTARIEDAVAKLEQAFGGLDLLVNNAGAGYRALVSELEDGLLERLFRTNVLALLQTSRLALPLLRRGELPVVVNVSSVVGRRGIPGQVAYAASRPPSARSAKGCASNGPAKASPSAPSIPP